MKISYIFDEGESKEDAYLIGSGIFGVFDGANSSTHFFDSDGRPGGLIAATIVRDEFEKNKETNKETLKEMAVAANKKIRDAMTASGVDITDKGSFWCTTAAVVRVNENDFEWLQVSDSLILVIYDDGSFKLLVAEYDHDMENLVHWKQFADKKEKDIRNRGLMKKFWDQHRLDMNVTYGGMDGEPQMENFIKQGKESLESVKHIILFTDGLVLPKENPQDPDDFETFVQLFLEGGLHKVLKHVRNLEESDPECWKYPRFKNHDDITAISITF